MSTGAIVILVLVLVILSLGAGGAAVWFYLKRKKNKAEDGAKVVVDNSVSTDPQREAIKKKIEEQIKQNELMRQKLKEKLGVK